MQNLPNIFKPKKKEKRVKSPPPTPPTPTINSINDPRITDVKIEPTPEPSKDHKFQIHNFDLNLSLFGDEGNNGQSTNITNALITIFEHYQMIINHVEMITKIAPKSPQITTPKDTLRAWRRMGIRLLLDDQSVVPRLFQGIPTYPFENIYTVELFWAQAFDEKLVVLCADHTPIHITKGNTLILEELNNTGAADVTGAVPSHSYLTNVKLRGMVVNKNVNLTPKEIAEL